MKLIKKFIDVILPPRCPITGQIVDEAGMISSEAWAELRFLSEPYCSCCGLPFSVELEQEERGENFLCGECLAHPPTFDAARAALVYDAPARELVLGFKHADQTHLTVTFTPWLQKIFEKEEWKIDLLIPVPLHWTRLLHRRYNQAALLATSLSRVLKIPYELLALKRVRRTEIQAHLEFKDRQENVKNAFLCVKKYEEKIRGKNILLIDDVHTTGATLKECATILKNSGANKVYVLTIARTGKEFAG